MLGSGADSTKEVRLKRNVMFAGLLGVALAFGCKSKQEQANDEFRKSSEKYDEAHQKLSDGKTDEYRDKMQDSIVEKRKAASGSQDCSRFRSRHGVKIESRS